MVKIYTRTGDKGETSLLDGSRLSKDSLRVEAYGDIDELNSLLGVVRAFMKDDEINSLLEAIQRDLFIVGADLASALESKRTIQRVTGEMVASIEKQIDRYDMELPPLKAFILPGGSEASSLLHLARTVARRAERSIVTLSKSEKINVQLIPCVNRLSDLFFILARVVNLRAGNTEVEWH